MTEQTRLAHGGRSATTAEAAVGGSLEDPEALGEAIAAEMALAWEHGPGPAAEVFLARHPGSSGLPVVAARVVYEEYCLREGLGRPAGTSEFLERFPQWRAELEVLIDCHRLVSPRGRPPVFPEVGEVLGDYRLRAVLGRGLRGCVYLATQESLADRPVALKVTSHRGEEHLSLARLQHPHVVPLYAFQDFPERSLRALCMPYLGGTTLDQALALMAPNPPVQRRGADFLQVLDATRTEYVALPPWSATRQFLSGTTYDHAVCWLGACVADALHYAHERGLIHLDLKPSNLLLADDGQPMLLDFHLACGPLQPLAGAVEHLGGTRGYFSPEQSVALAALRRGRPVPVAIDGRSDVYSLGVVLFELLTGALPPSHGDADGGAPDLEALLLQANPRAGSSLARVVGRCLAASPAERYPDAARLASDLRRHLEHRPLGDDPRPGLFSFWKTRRRRH